MVYLQWRAGITWLHFPNELQQSFWTQRTSKAKITRNALDLEKLIVTRSRELLKYGYRQETRNQGHQVKKLMPGI